MEPTEQLRRYMAPSSSSIGDVDADIERFLNEMEAEEIASVLAHPSPPPPLITPSRPPLSLSLPLPSSPSQSSVPLRMPSWQKEVGLFEPGHPFCRPVRMRERTEIVEPVLKSVPLPDPFSSSFSFLDDSDSPPPAAVTLKRKPIFPATLIPPKKAARLEAHPSPRAAASPPPPPSSSALSPSSSIDWAEQERLLVEIEFEMAIDAATFLLHDIASDAVPTHLSPNAHRRKFKLVSVLNWLVAELPAMFAATKYPVVVGLIKHVLRRAAIELNLVTAAPSCLQEIADAGHMPGPVLMVIVRWVRAFDTRFVAHDEEKDRC